MDSSSASLLPRPFPGGCLRRMRPSDLADFQTYRNVPELGRYQGWSVRAEAEALAFLAFMETVVPFQTGQWIQIGIAEAASDTLIGDIGLRVSDDRHVGEVGFTLAPFFQGRGIATNAVHEAVRLLFTGTEVTCVHGITDARNTRSIRLLERLGFTCQEVRDVVFRNEACTEHVFVLGRQNG